MFQGRRNGIGGGVRLEADRLGQQVGVLARPIRLDPSIWTTTAWWKEPVEERGRDVRDRRRCRPIQAKPRFEVRIHRALFVSGVDELEEEIAAARRDGEVAPISSTMKQREAAVVADPVAKSAGRVRPWRARGDDVSERAEVDAAAGFDHLRTPRARLR